MKAYIGVDDTGRINASTTHEEFAIGMTEFTFPDDFDFSLQNEYRVVSGELVHDPLPESPDGQIAELKQKLAETDYMVVKVYEAMITGEELPEDDTNRYSDAIIQRQQWRSQINELENSMEGGE